MPSFSFDYELFDSTTDAPPELASLAYQALDAAEKLAYAPYSHFHVGAAVLLENGAIVQGSNQENASYPAGVCAERVALGVASSLHPAIKIQAIAVAYFKENISEVHFDHILSPCGICRQVISEVAAHQGSPIQLVLTGASGKLMLIKDANHLLPFTFGKELL